jgi:hypothetical protein
MSNSYNYLPNPPRVWSRVQNPCTYIVPDNSYNSIYIPLTNQTVTLAQANLEEKIQYKGNILQYKGNSSRITKNQRYSQISRGLWSNRTKVFATQSQTYTNPNTSSLARVNSTSIPFPNQIVGSPNNISGPFQYGIPNPNNCNTTTIEDGGSLLCGSYANPCTGEIIQTVTEQQCYPTYCSDVPGQIMDLCWNPKLQTFFPRNRLTMSNSLNKWPQGYKGLVSALTEALPNPPQIVSATSNYYDVTIEWTYTNVCSTISGFNIYQNGELIRTVPYQIKSTIINNLENCQSYTYYVTAFNSVGDSVPSNIVTATIFVPLPPTITNITQINTSTTINWVPNLNCSAFTNYLLYENNKLLFTLPSSETTITLNLTNCGVYAFYLVSYNSNTNVFSLQSNVASTSVVPLPPTLSGSSTSFSSITLNWVPAVTCATVTGWNIYDNTSGIPNLVSTISDATVTTQVITGLTSGSTYIYYITAIYSGGESAPSAPPTSVTVNSLYTITSGPTPTIVTSGNYTGLVFSYSAPYPSQSLTTIVFNYQLTIGILMVGGGSSGGAGYNVGPDPGAGGGGGGVVNINSYLISTGTTYYITPGYGAIASSGNGAMPNAGGSSLFYTITSGPNYIYQATGGTNSSGSFNPGSGGNGYYNNQLIQYTNGGSGGLSFGGNQQNGGTCEISSVSLPISVTYTLGGGGGSGAANNSAGGACGNGIGGNLGGNTVSPTVNGQSAPPPASPNSYGGGGGGGTYSSSTSYPGGNGGNGVVVIWWQNP